MEARLSILIFALLSLTGIRSEVFDEQKPSDDFKHVTDDHDSYLHSFAEASLKVITQGTKINSLSDFTDIHQQLDYVKTSLLSEKENATNNPDLQYELETKIEMIEFLCRILNNSEENAQKKKLENLNAYKKFSWPSPTKMEHLVYRDAMLSEDHTLEQSENGQYIVQTTIPPSSEHFGEATNEDITLKHNILNQSQNDQNLEKITFSLSTELLPGTTNGNMPLKNDTLEQSRDSQNLIKTTFPPPSKFFGYNGTTAQTVFSTDSEQMKDVTKIPTDNNNSSELFFRSWLAALLPGYKTNSSHLNTTNIPQILPLSDIGKIFRSDKKQNSFYPNRNSDMKASKTEGILNIWKILLDELEGKTTSDEDEFLNLSSSTSVTDMEMNMTDPTSHPSEFDDSISSTLEISNVSYSVIDDDNSSTLISSSTLKSEASNSLTKQSSSTVVPTIFGTNYVLSTEHTFTDISTNSSNINETTKHPSSLSVSGNELPTTIEDSKKNDRQQSFNGKKAKSLENIAPGINAEKVNSRFPVTIISGNKELSDLRDMTQKYANMLEQSRSALKDIYTRETESGQFREDSKVSNFEDSENKNAIGFTKETQRDQNPWKNPLYPLSFFKIPTGFEKFENEHAAKTSDSTINRKMEEEKILKILIPLGNMEENFLNESSQSLQIEMKPFGIKHSNKIPSVYSFIKIEYSEFIRDKNADEIAKEDLINFQVENSPNNGTNKLAKVKRSGGKDHW